MSTTPSTSIKLRAYHDPGRGWLAVKTAHLKELGIADQVSVHSYQRGQSTYLDEGCDARLYRQALEARNIAVEIKDSHTNKSSPIRSYDVYKAA